MRKDSLKKLDVELIYTSCDTLAKDESISVYLLKAGANKRPAPLRWLSEKTLVFQYDPALVDGPLPLIRETSDGAISISVPRVSSVLLQERTWENKPIRYQIGQIDYR